VRSTPPRRQATPVQGGARMGERTCSIDGCNKPSRVRGWCVTHYHRFNRHGDPLVIRQMVPKRGMKCSILDCEKPVAGRGWCQAHYRRWKVFGDPLLGGPLKSRPGPQPCPIAGCVKKTRKRGLCTAHYQRWQAHGDPNYGGAPVHTRREPGTGQCIEVGCLKHRMISDWCAPHYRQQWRKLNPEKLRSSVALRRMRKFENAGGALEVTPRDWRRMLLLYKHACAYCGRGNLELHAEHVVPIARGGRHAIGNLLPACKTCNGSKGSKLLSEWRYRNPRQARSRNAPLLLRTVAS
jgi:5-methylcytosine-specific restriction endonuclease McrA